MKIFAFILGILLSCPAFILAQDQTGLATELMNEAQSSLAQKEYVKARYYFKQAFKKFAAEGDYKQSVRNGIEANALYLRENLYQEGFDLCRDMEQVIREGEQKSGKPLYDLRFLVADERLQMYTALKNPTRAKDQLARLEETARLAKNDSLNRLLLFTQANYYYNFGQERQGDNSFRQLIDLYKQQKDYRQVNESYRELIGTAVKANNARLVANLYEKYRLWTDSVQTLTARDELNALQQKYDDNLQLLADKDQALSVKQYKIVGLCILSLILAAAVAFLVLLLLRMTVSNKKLKKNVRIANEHSRLKSEFIRNISSQMEPTLNRLAETVRKTARTPDEKEQLSVPIEALKKFSNDIQELSNLENTLDKPYESKDIHVHPFCESVMNRVKGEVRPEVATVVDAVKLQIKSNPEQLERILLHLLKNAAYYTETGKITLEYKRRGARAHQFIVTDSGPGIPPERQEDLFKPFTEIQDLTQGDGLGLPICSLIAAKLNGNLSLDTTYKHGARFVLDIHS